jgi:hypothetical protein
MILGDNGIPGNFLEPKWRGIRLVGEVYDRDVTL